MMWDPECFSYSDVSVLCVLCCSWITWFAKFPWQLSENSLNSLNMPWSIHSWLGPYHRPPCTPEAAADTTIAYCYCTVQRYRLYICHPPTVRTHLYLMYRKSEHHSRTECCRCCINKTSSCSHWLLLTSQWVIPHRAMVVYKGERSKLCTCLRRPVTLCKLLILSLLMCSPPRIEQHICLHIDSASVSHNTFANPQRRYSLLIATPARYWSGPIFIDFSLPMLQCILAHHNDK